MRALLFGTYDTSLHPRIGTIAEGLRARGIDVTECNAPLGLDTAARVGMLAHPWRAPALLTLLARRWLTLARNARRMPVPDVVLVGYLGHFDVHLARLIFRRVPIVLDHLIGASDTARDRRLGGIVRQALLKMIDAAALRARGIDVTECNAPLGLDTAARVGMLAHPWRAPALLALLARRWLTLARNARRMPVPDVVLVGYLGHFDVHLARLIFRRVPIVLDHLIGASDTARDRRLGGIVRQALLKMIDAAALRAADIVVVDTEEHLARLPERHRARAVVVPVGAPLAWYLADRPAVREALCGTALCGTACGTALCGTRRAAAGGVLRSVHPPAGRSGHRRRAGADRRGAPRGHHDR